MRLLLIALVTGFVFLINSSGKFPEMFSPRSLVFEGTMLEAHPEASLSEVGTQENWLRAYAWMLKVLNPVKQLDLPVDNSKSGHCLSCKVLAGGVMAGQSLQAARSFTSQFMGVLSARYQDGFYIYSLKKLLI